MRCACLLLAQAMLEVETELAESGRMTGSTTARKGEVLTPRGSAHLVGGPETPDHRRGDAAWRGTKRGDPPLGDHLNSVQHVAKR